jgi:hypothetical protein
MPPVLLFPRHLSIAHRLGQRKVGQIQREGEEGEISTRRFRKQQWRSRFTSAAPGSFCKLVAFAGLMSGMTLGLMSLSLVDLEVLSKSGTPLDQKHAGKFPLPLSNIFELIYGTPLDQKHELEKDVLCFPYKFCTTKLGI